MKLKYLIIHTIIFTGLFGHAEQTWVPHIADEAGSFLTELVFTNTNPTKPLQFVIQPYAVDGTALAVVTLELMPRATRRMAPAAIFGSPWVSHLSIESDPTGHVVVSYASKDPRGGIAHVPALAARHRRYVFFASNRGTVWDGAALVNLGPDSALIEAVSYNDSGDEMTRATIAMQLPPLGQMKMLIDDVFPGVQGLKLALESSQPLSLLLLRGSRGNFSYLAQTVPIPSSPTAKAELVFKNGTVFTADDRQLFAEAVAVADGKIIFVGKASLLEPMLTPQTEIIDLNGGMLLPGLHDVHMHPLEAISAATHFNLNEDEQDVRRHIAKIRQAAQRNPDVPWLIGYGHSIFGLLELAQSPRAWLDQAEPNRPVVILEQTSHSVWCNSRALALAGIDATSPHPPGGYIVKDPISNQPNGLLLDNAGNRMMDLAIAANPSLAESNYRGLLNVILPRLARNGITSICDARTYWKRNHHRTWQRLADQNQLSVRVNLGLWAYPHEDDASQIATLKSLYRNEPDSLLKINQIKLYSDGIVINTTAALKQPYLEKLFEIPQNKGLNYFSQARLTHYIRQLEDHGFDFHIHAIGDRGVHEALNAVEQGSNGRGRHRVTHLEMVDSIDMARFHQLNVTADGQVSGDFAQPANWHESDDLLGPERADNLVPIKSLHAAGARLTLSSDWDVSAMNPLIGLQNAITRAPQAIALKDALKAYTIHAAYVMRQETRVGSIEIGKEADLVVLDQNLFAIEKNLINRAKILRTYLSGQLIYTR